MRKAILTGIVGLIVGVIGGVLYVDHIARPVIPPLPEPQQGFQPEPVISFVIAEGVYKPVTLAPRQIAVSQEIFLSRGDQLWVLLRTNYWWETSLGVGMNLPPVVTGVPGHYLPLAIPLNAEITVSRPYPDEYEVWLSYRVERAEHVGWYRVVLENKFADRTIHARLAYWKY